MTTRNSLTRRTDPALQDYQAGWLSDSAKPSEPFAQRTTRESRQGHGLGHQVRNGLQLGIIALLLTLLVLDRRDELRALVQWPTVALTPTTNTALKPASDVVKQRYERLVQEMGYQKAMIKNAKQSIDLTQQNLDRFLLELAANQAALDALKAEYDLTGLDE